MLSPLELLNLYLTEGKSVGPVDSKLYQKFNTDLTWDTMLNHGYQSDLAPLLYHIITKTDTLNQTNLSCGMHKLFHQDQTNSINEINPKNQINQINKINKTNNNPSSLYHISDSVMSKLKQLYHQNLVRSMIQFSELDKILDTFEKEGIDVIQLKGAELAKNYYPDQALRPMCDFDLLVRKEDIKRAKECLINQGYKFQKSRMFEDEDSYEKKHFHFPFIKQNEISSILVELHQDIAAVSDPIKNNVNEIWKSSFSINGNRHVLTASKEYFVLHLFWHTYLNLSEHLYMRLIWLLDIAYMINKYDTNIDWFFVEKKSKESKIQKQVYFCLYLLIQLFSEDFDKKIMRTLMPTNGAKKIFNFVMLKMENNIQAINDPNRFLIVLLNLLSLNTMHERTNYLFRYNYSFNPLSKKEWIKRKYRLSTQKAIYLHLIIHPIISILKFLKGMYNIFNVKHNT